MAKKKADACLARFTPTAGGLRSTATRARRAALTGSVKDLVEINLRPAVKDMMLTFQQLGVSSKPVRAVALDLSPDEARLLAAEIVRMADVLESTEFGSEEWWRAMAMTSPINS